MFPPFARLRAVAVVLPGVAPPVTVNKTRRQSNRPYDTKVPSVIRSLNVPTPAPPATPPAGGVLTSSLYTFLAVASAVTNSGPSTCEQTASSVSN